eukprot:3263690-Prymnesium_polylepis.1
MAEPSTALTVPTPTLVVRDELTKLRSASSEWMLAQDTSLQKVLEQISARVEQRQKEVEGSLGQFALDVEHARTRLSNVVNDFDALSYTQFMEHRVYDEEAPSAEESAEPAALTNGMGGAEEDQAALVAEYSSLVKAGLEALSAFPMPDDDVDPAANGDVPGGAAKWAGLQFGELALPFVIGTPEFQSNDNCGLFAADEDRAYLRASHATSECARARAAPCAHRKRGALGSVPRRGGGSAAERGQGGGARDGRHHRWPTRHHPLLLRAQAARSTWISMRRATMMTTARPIGARAPTRWRRLPSMTMTTTTTTTMRRRRRRRRRATT